MPQARDEAGNIWEVDAQGNPVRLIQPAQSQGTFIADPAAQYEAPAAAAQAQQAQAQANVTQQRAPAEVATGSLPPGMRWVDPNDPSRGMTAIEVVADDGRPEITSQTYAEALKGFTSSMALGETIKQLEERFQDGPGGTSGFLSVKDYLPLEVNERFDRAASSARGTIADVLGFTGSQLNSAAEIEANLGPYVPTSTDKDGTIRDSIQRLKDLQQQGIDRTVALLGGVPDEAGNIIPVKRGEQLTAQNIPEFIQSANTPQAAGFGATERRGELPEGLAESVDGLRRQLASGDINLEDYARARVGLDQGAYGDEAKNQYLEYLEEGYQFQQFFNQGGSPEQLGDIQPPNVEMSGFEQGMNNLAASEVGTGIANYADSTLLGLGSAVYGDQMRMAADLNPKAAMAGQIGGALTGTTGLGRLAGTAAAKYAPRLLGGGKGAQFGRNVATDTAYGTTYGTAQGQDVSDAALASTLGSLGGNIAGKAIGGAVGGARLGKAVESLRNRGIPLTTGQTLGGFAKSVEDRMTSLPFVGDMVNARRLEGLQEFNRQAFGEAGAPIGFQARRIGSEGVEDMNAAVGNAYDSALSGVNVPIDQQFLDATQVAVEPLRNLPQDIRRPMGQVMQARTQNIADAGRITGPDYQAARRALKRTRNSPPQRFGGFEQEYQNAATGLIDALDEQVARGAGPDVISALDNANTSNRLGKIVENATERAKGGSTSGEVRTFTPSQLQMANQASGRRFPGNNPLIELADQGQRVLPSRIPDSGTAGRVAQMALPGAAAAGGGAGYAFDGVEGAQAGATSSAALASALMLLGTKRGQQSLNTVLATRPDALRNAVEYLRRSRLLNLSGGGSGALGSAAVPLALNAQ